MWDALWILACTGLFVLGSRMSIYFNNNYMEDKAKPGNRTPIHIRGNFYYVMTEQEYNVIMNTLRVAQEADEERERTAWR